MEGEKNRDRILVPSMCHWDLPPLSPLCLPPAASPPKHSFFLPLLPTNPFCHTHTPAGSSVLMQVDSCGWLSPPPFVAVVLEYPLAVHNCMTLYNSGTGVLLSESPVRIRL